MVIVAFFSLFSTYDHELNKHQSELIARSIAENIKSEIDNRIRALKFFSQVEAEMPLNPLQSFEDNAQKLIELYPDIYAINWIDQKGVITKVYPESNNQAAYKKNLLERSDVHHYLENSLELKSAQITHRLITFQGIYAFAMYVPIFVNKKFIGWVNAVFDLDGWVKKYVLEQKWDHIRILIDWKHPESQSFSYGEASIPLTHHFQFTILNQVLQFNIGFGQNPFMEKRKFSLWMVLLFAGFLTCFIFFLSQRMIRDESKLAEVNSNLSMSNVLISSLTHDISNPLFALSITLERAMKSQQTLNEIEKKRIQSTLKTIQDMLQTGRQIHSLKLGQTQLTPQPVNLETALTKSLDIVRELTDLKGLVVQLPTLQPPVYVYAEPKTLTHNVLPNIISNAVKFSMAQGHITFTVIGNAGFVDLLIDDEGTGIPQEELEKIKKHSPLSVKSGTQGETGTGLGLLQVSYFMEFYGGVFTITNKEFGGVRVRLSFKAAPAPV